MAQIKETVEGGYFGRGDDPVTFQKELDGLLKQARGGFNIGTRNFLGALSERGVIKPGMSVLEVGCGPGLAFPVLAEYFDAITGIDIDPKRLPFAQRIAQELGLDGRVQVKREDATSLPFEDNSYDVASARIVVSHLTQRQRDKAVDEMMRVAKVIVLEDIDILRDEEGSWQIQPGIESFDWLHSVMLRLYDYRDADPGMGRRLGELYKKHGLTTVAENSYAVTSNRTMPMHGAHTDIFARLRANVIDLGLAQPKEFDDNLNSLKNHLFREDMEVMATSPRINQRAGI